MAKTPESRSKSFLIRDIHPNILIGAASDRYAGWIGQGSKKRIAHGAWSIAKELNPFLFFADNGPGMKNCEEVKRDFPQEP